MDKLTIAELHKKYHRTTALIKLADGTHFPMYVDGITFDNDGIAVIIGNGDRSSFKLGASKLNPMSATFKMKDISILPMPDTKVFDYNGRTFVFKRSPNRQYRKGICGDNSHITDVQANIIEFLTLDKRVKRIGESIKMSHSVAHHLLTTTHAKTLVQAIKDIEDNKLLSRSVSDVYWVGLYPDKTKPYILYRYDIPLAYYDKNLDDFTLLDKHYHQEVVDFCNRLKLTSKVI